MTEGQAKWIQRGLSKLGWQPSEGDIWEHPLHGRQLWQDAAALELNK